MAEAAPVPLTVVVSTTQPWPEIEACLDSLHDQGREAGAELLAIDGSGAGLPPDARARYPALTALRMPGASIFQMRAFGLLHAKGELVAVTEDHCRVAPDWCRSILAAHREWPAAAAIGGIVENGATASLLDWAHFVAVNGDAMPPLATGPRRRVTLQANVSYKRSALPREFPAWGYMEWMLNEDLVRRGESLVSDCRIRVHHVQSFTLGQACATHYHDSRSIAGFRARRIGRLELLVRTGAAATVMMPLILARSLRPLAVKRRNLQLLWLGLPYFALLAAARAAGALVGFVRGEGTSPLRIR